MARGLSDTDIDGLRRQLEAGKRPRVQLSGPHFPVGATGTVVRIGQPDVDGTDYLRVRVKVDNMTDELAFGPAELKLPGRPARKRAARPAGSAATRPAATRPAPPTAPATTAPAATAPAATAPAATAPAATAPAVRTAPPNASLAETGSATAEPVEAGSTKAGSTKAASARPASAKAASARPASAKAASRKAASAQAQPPKSGLAPGGLAPSGPARSGAIKPSRRRTGPMQKVTFTVASSGAAWALVATRGSKNVVKNVPLAPGVVDALAELLDQPALTEAIGEINDAALAEAHARAEQLRAELSQLEAVLATHHRP